MERLEPDALFVAGKASHRGLFPGKSIAPHIPPEHMEMWMFFYSESAFGGKPFCRKVLPPKPPFRRL